MYRRSAAALLALAAFAGGASAAAAAPAPLSADKSRPPVDSTFGSGAFGTWGVDADGLPRYRYTIDEQVEDFAAQPEISGRREAWHQLGNDHIVADAFNHGYTQLWSQDHLAQWANYYDAPNQHYAGGFGWLVVDGKPHSSLYLDRAKGADTQRDFGVGYARHAQNLGGIDVTDHVYSPFGDDPLLLHDVALHNPGSGPVKASWIEYWDVNPYFPGSHSDRGTEAPAWDASSATLRTRLLPTHPQDTDPLTIFAAALSGPVDGFETDATAFFGAGTRAQPVEVVADHLGGTLGGNAPDGNLAHTMFALRAPVTIPAGGTVTLRYAYGMARPEQVAPLVAKYGAAADPLGASQHAWKEWLPRTSFAGHDPWMSRELEWDAYMVRSGATYEECAGRHIISQGGYYQYDLDFQGAFRDPLQHMLPIIYSDPALARDVLLYSAAEQPTNGGPIPYARISGCTRFDLGTSDDLDLWLLLAASEYGLATRDMALFDTPVPWQEGGTATLWQHLKDSFRWQETQRGAHGGYVTGTFGDWSDLSTPLEQMTESMLVAAQGAYIYPRLAQLADARHDTAFAAQLRAT
ncbi:MAG: cellobiose phosphorylase, partial [Thermoleophilaceae bacterium]|nr:cellobiose phosphorylase [Thermoleophilaceae bacterium]